MKNASSPIVFLLIAIVLIGAASGFIVLRQRADFRAAQVDVEQQRLAAQHQHDQQEHIDELLAEVERLEAKAKLQEALIETLKAERAELYDALGRQPMKAGGEKDL